MAFGSKNNHEKACQLNLNDMYNGRVYFIRRFNYLNKLQGLNNLKSSPIMWIVKVKLYHMKLLEMM
jgi:hypothetical protein